MKGVGINQKAKIKSQNDNAKIKILNFLMDVFMDDVFIGKGELDEKGVYANRDFTKGEVVLKYKLKQLTEKKYKKLPDNEKKYTHRHWGNIYLYSSPERYVNHSSSPNTLPDLKKHADIAARDIKKGEQITTDSAKDDIT